jgi:hypothetical protein
LTFSSFFSVIPTGMADFFFRAAVWRVGHGAEGPWQHFDLISAIEISKPFLEGGLPFALSKNVNESSGQLDAGPQKSR